MKNAFQYICTYQQFICCHYVLILLIWIAFQCSHERCCKYFSIYLFGQFTLISTGYGSNSFANVIYKFTVTLQPLDNFICYSILLKCAHVLKLYISCSITYIGLNIWGQNKVAAIFQMTLSNGFFWVKMHEFLLKFYWSWFLGVQLTIFWKACWCVSLVL